MAESTINIIKIQDTVGDNYKIGAETATKLQSSLSTSGTENLYAVGTDGKSIVYFNDGIPVKSTVSLGDNSTPIYLKNGVLTTGTAIGNGQLSISANNDSHLTASGTFTANQSSDSSLTIGVESGYAIPTSTQITNWNTAYGWGNHAEAGYLDESDGIVISTSINELYDTKADKNHTHATSIETSDDTSQISLVHGGKYSINAGGTSYVFTMPTAPTVGSGTFTIKSKQGSDVDNVADFGANQTSNNDITFIGGSNITLTPDTTNKTITIAATGVISGIDITVPSTDATYPILLGNTDVAETNVTSIKKSVGLVVNPSKKSVAEGQGTTAFGSHSHAEGKGSLTQLSNISSRTARTITFSTLPSDIKIGSIIKAVNGVYAKVTNINASTKVVTVDSNLSTTGSLYLVYGVAYGESSHTEGENTTASGTYSHAEGYGTVAYGTYSHAEGRLAQTTAGAQHSHAEGNVTIARGVFSHAEGTSTNANGEGAHAEGLGTFATGNWSHAEGNGATANGTHSHAEGNGTTANGTHSHAEGNGTTASGIFSHTEGTSTRATTEGAHAEGQSTTASGIWSHSEGQSTTASGTFSHAEGQSTTAFGSWSHAEGNQTRAEGNWSHAEGNVTIARGVFSHAEGNRTNANGEGAHAEGFGTFATGNWSHAEGNLTSAASIHSHTEGFKSTATNIGAHAEGNNTSARGQYSHAEGGGTAADADYSHAEGQNTTASNVPSHAEGAYTTASGPCSHAEGNSSIAAGNDSHAEGHNTRVGGYEHGADGPTPGTYSADSIGEYAHAEGNATIAKGNDSHAEGKQTLADGYAAHAEGNCTTTRAAAAHAEGQGSVSELSGISSRTARTITFSTLPSGIKIGSVIEDANGACAKVTNITSTKVVMVNSNLSTTGSLYVLYGVAYGESSHTEGNYTTASGSYSHAEGNNTSASGYMSHSEGESTIASNTCSHAEGNYTTASGPYSHSEGQYTFASGESSHTEGSGTKASGRRSHAEGEYTIASGTSSHTEGNYTTASGSYSHAEGQGSVSQLSDISSRTARTITFSTLPSGIKIGSVIEDANGACAKVTNINASTKVVTVDSNLSTTGSLYLVYGVAYGESSHTEGNYTTASGNASHAEGSNTTASGYYSHAEGAGTIASGSHSHSEGMYTTASNTCSHTEGNYTTASGNYSHAEGNYTTASGNYSHAEGEYTIAFGTSSHTEGNYTTASGSYSHAEGQGSLLQLSNSSISERTATTITFSALPSDIEIGSVIKDANGAYAKVTNINTSTKVVTVGSNLSTTGSLYVLYGVAYGESSHAEGDNTTASGSRSHASGLGTIANQDNMTAIGTYNTSGETGDLFVIGNGSDNGHRSNVLSVNGSTKKITLDSDGGIKLPSGGSNTKVWNTNGGITELSEGTNISLSDDGSGEVTINANIPKTQHELIYFDPERTNNGYDGLITAQLMYEDGIVVDNPADFNKCIGDTSWEEIDFTMQDVAENYITELISCNPYINGRGGTGDGNILQDSGFTKGAINDSSNPFWGYDSNKDYITAKFNDNWGSRIAFIYNEDAPDKYFIHDALYGYSANDGYNDCIGLAFFAFNKTVFTDGSTQSYGDVTIDESSYLKTTRLQIDLGVRPSSKNIIMSLGMEQNKRKPDEDITYLADAYWRNGAPDKEDTKLGQPYKSFTPAHSSSFSIIGNSSSSPIQASTMLNPGSYDGADGRSTIGFVRCVTERSENIYRFKFSQPSAFTWTENYKHTIGQQVVASEIIIDMDEYKIHYKPIGATSFTTIDVTDSTQKALFDEFKNNDVYYGFWQSSTPQGAIYNISYTRGSESSLSNLILNTDNDTVWQYTYDGWQQLTQYIPLDLFSGSHLNYNHITEKLWYSNGNRIYELKADGGGGTSGINITAPTTNATYPILLGNTSVAESDVTSIQKSVGLVVNPSKKSVAEGQITTASGSCSHAEGYTTTAYGIRSHAEGQGSSLQLLNSSISERTATTITFSTLPSGIKIGSVIKDANGAYAKVTNINTSTKVVTVDSDLSTTAILYIERGISYGASSHAEGDNTTASGYYSHAEGEYTIASGTSSHAEGTSAKASGSYSHAEGQATTASGSYSHAEGNYTTASGYYSHAEGQGSSSQLSNSSISERTATTITFSTLPSEIKIGSVIKDANGAYAKVTNINTSTKVVTVDSDLSTTGNLYLVRCIAYGESSHAEGNITTASGDNSHTEGYYTIASGDSSHAEGNSTIASGDSSHAEGESTTASGDYSHAEGDSTTASGDSSHAEGDGSLSQLSGISSRTSTEITFSTLPSTIKIGRIIKDANGAYAKVTNINTSTKVVTVDSNLSTTGSLYLVRGIAYGDDSHAEGNITTASGDDSHTEGYNTIASGDDSHAEGGNTIASGESSHTEGNNTIASGDASHAEGFETEASGDYSHASGQYTIANRTAQTVVGKYNDESLTDALFVVGNGADNARSNAFYVENDGDVYASGAYYAASDKRKKDIIGDIDLEKAYSLLETCQTVIYTLKDDESKKQQIGVLAQEIQQFFPEIVNEDEHGMLSVDYSRLTVIILRVLKNVIDRVKKLEDR